MSGEGPIPITFEQPTPETEAIARGWQIQVAAKARTPLIGDTSKEFSAGRLVPEVPDLTIVQRIHEALLAEPKPVLPMGGIGIGALPEIHL